MACCILLFTGGNTDVDPRLAWVYEYLDLISTGGGFFFGAGMLFPLATTGAMEPFPYLAGAAGALVGGLQNVGSGIATWLSALLPQNGQFSLGMLMFSMSILILLCWLPLAHRMDRTENMI